MAGKGGKGLVAAKTTAASKDKDKKKPTSRSSRAGIQVDPFRFFLGFVFGTKKNISFLDTQLGFIIKF